MANIRPFSAYRPAPGLESRIAALPYDVYNREEAAEEVKETVEEAAGEVKEAIEEAAEETKAD